MDLYDILIYMVIALAFAAMFLILAITLHEVLLIQWENKRMKYKRKDRIINIWGHSQARIQVSGKAYLESLLSK